MKLHDNNLVSYNYFLFSKLNTTIKEPSYKDIPEYMLR